MRVALYLRRSTTDLQPDSLETQQEILEKYAADQSHLIVRIYQDSASGRSVDGRDHFQELIDTVKRGADFEAVLVRDVSRWGRFENTDEAGFYEFLCRSHGVQVIYVEESFTSDGSAYADMMKSLKRAMAAEFSRERARMVQVSHVRCVENGFWPTGSCPFGLKRVLVDESGNVPEGWGPGL